MPLRDHFHGPWSEQNPWEAFHSAWINTMVRHLNGAVLPGGFRAMPQVHLGSFVESQNTFEVRVFDDRRGMRLVAVVELVSPGNKDRAEHRHAFVAKCAGYLQERVGVVVVDIVTARRANLHQELLEMFGLALPEAGGPDLYAVAYCTRKDHGKWRLDLWPAAVTVGGALPEMPLWLASELAVRLELEPSYAETCRVLRIA